MPSQPSPTSSATVLTVAAAFATAAGIAYYSSPSSSPSSSSSTSSSSTSSSATAAATAVGTLVRELLRALKAEEESATNQQQPRDETALAYASWLEQEEKRDSDNGYNPDHERWMCETIDNALRSAVPSASLSLSAMPASTLTSTSTSKSTSLIPPTPCSGAPLSRSEPAAVAEVEHRDHPPQRRGQWDTVRRSFPALRRAVETLVRHEPEVRERFFGGTLPDREVHHVYSSSSSSLSLSRSPALSSSPDDDWIDRRRARSVSVSSASTSSSSSSGSLSANSSSSCRTDDFLVEDEREVERLLRYLLFVEMAGHREDDDNYNYNDSHSHNHNEQRRQQQQRKRRRKRSPSISDADGLYEILDGGSVEATATLPPPDPDPEETVSVGYLTAVHSERREVVLSLNYAADRIRKVLAKSLRWQNRTEDLDAVVDRVWETVLEGYLPPPSKTKEEEEEEARSSSRESTATTTTAARVSFLLSSGYSLVVCGHSLGATLACRLGAASGERNPSLAVRVYAFGPPPCLARDEASESDTVRETETETEQNPTAATKIATATATTATTTSITFVVNNHDCIPRWTPSNLAVLSRLSKQAKRSRFQHFRRYHQARCPVPTFWFSSREWSRFWKNESSERGGGGRNRGRGRTDASSLRPQKLSRSQSRSPRQLVVPERVVCLWNHSRDPTIIGAKVHHRPTGAVVGGGDGFPRRTHHVLGRLWPDRSMFHDHTLEAYAANLELLLEQVANTI